MDIPSLINNVAMPVIRRVAGSARAIVRHEPTVGRDTYGPKYGDIILREAIVEALTEPVASADGTERLSSAKLTFLEGIVVEERDRFTLPNGDQANVIKRGGLMRPDGIFYVTEVWLGK